MTRTESKWAERVADWRASGQSGADYARGREFKPSTLYWWSSRIGRDDVRGTEREGSTRAPSVRMVRVVAVSKPSTSGITVRIGAAQVDVRAGFDATLLREVVQALGGER
jgi:hypothetical protein